MTLQNLEKRNMSKQKFGIATAIFLIFVMSISLATTATGVPAITGNTKAYPFIGATPNPVGVGQETLFHTGITQPLRATQDGWSGITITVTKPDGTKETLGPFRTDATGGTGTTYVPDVPGVYQVQTHFPGQWYNYTQSGTQYNLFYEEADSKVLNLTVSDVAINLYPGVPLPTEYWSRPIDAQAREWATIGGNWLGLGQFGDNLAGSVMPDNDLAPESAHVLWAKPLEYGGLVGDYDYSLFGGDAYEGKFAGGVIINGIMYYNRFNAIGIPGSTIAGVSAPAVENYVVAVDIHTGQQLWQRTLKAPDGTNVTLSFGQVLKFTSFNVQGAFTYLWGSSGSTWYAFDPADGRWLFTMTNVPSASTTVGPNGEFLKYVIDQRNGYMLIWNSSAVIDCYWGTNPNSPNWGSWRPQGKIINATGPVATTFSTPFGLNGYQKNVTIPKGLPGSVSYYVAEDIAIGYNRAAPENINNPPFTIWAISLKPGSEGQLLYNKTYAAPEGNVTFGYSRVGVQDRVFVIFMKDLGTLRCYNLDTGAFMWATTEPEFYLSYLETWTVIADGKIYTHGTKGIINCYDVKTGKPLWQYALSDPLSEIKWSDNWIARIDFIADGKIYIRHSAHSDNQPLPRGAPYVCLNATSGEVIWRANGLVRGTDWGGRGYIGDSTLVKLDTYDLLIFAIGKGPSATEVEASPSVSTHGSRVLVQGSVTDISPGTADYKIAARFPDGVPAVSDASMSDWMTYVYKQLPKPTNATGVEVVIEVFDPNGNYYEVARTTSDATGFYKAAFTPEVPGEYTVVARFAGTNSYYGSYSETAIVVDPAAATPSPQPQITLPPIEMYVVGATVAILIAIAILGVLILRKKP